MANKFYITTPIYYVNAAPHIGHSYTTIAADTMARYERKLLGQENVWFLTGTDEHGQKIQKAADEAHLSPQEFVDQIVPQFKTLWKTLNLSYDDFIRTTEERHTKTVQRVLEILYAKKVIYQDKYEGWYCTPCETFWPKTQISAGLCPDCQRPVEKISENNYFLKISDYQEWLASYIRKHPSFIQPEIRRNEIESFLTLNKLENLCISRPKERMSWGIELPFSREHVTYVWFDALINYISAVGEFDIEGNYHSRWWAEDARIVHFIGKDILRQHAVYWPIMLQALGLRQPDTVFAHGWWMLADTKMSKSRGNVVSPADMVGKFGIDTYRYFLLRDVVFGMDGNFSESAIIKRFNGDLANDLGNSVYRTLTMVEKYFQGEVPKIEISSAQEEVKKIMEKIRGLNDEVAAALASFNFSLALENIWALISLINKHVEETKPWNLAKENKLQELEAFIRLLVEALRKVSAGLEPFLPKTCAAIEAQLGSDKIAKGEPLFPRIETK